MPLALDAPDFHITYRAQAVVEGVRVARAIGPQGQVGLEWEASAFIDSLPEAMKRPFRRLARHVTPKGLSHHAHVSEGERDGRLDAVLTQPELPDWIRNDTGPFTLLIHAQARPQEATVAQRQAAQAQDRLDHLERQPATDGRSRQRA